MISTLKLVVGGVIAWKQDGKIFYNFKEIKPTEEAPLTSLKHSKDVPEDLQRLLKKSKECVNLAYTTCSEVGSYVQ